MSIEALLRALKEYVNSDFVDDELNPRKKMAIEAIAEAEKPAQPKAEQEPINGPEADPSAFVRWAEKAGYDMTCHPLHFLFLDQKTNAARMGWKAAVEHYNPQPAHPKAGETK